MPTKALKTLDAVTCEQWREWLVKHQDSESEVWLIFHKRLDDARYARKFTPRKLDSKWSMTNRKRYAHLRLSGRLMAAGLERPPTSRSDDGPRPVPSKMPQYIQQALRGRPAARNYFERLAPSYRRMYIGWIDSAKQQETRMRRLREALDLLAAGKKLGLK